MTEALARIDAIIAADPESQRWSFEHHQRGALHTAERLMTLQGAEAGALKIAGPKAPRSITAVRIKRRGAAKPGGAAPDSGAIPDAPGTAELCRFLTLLNSINRHCPWAPHAFSANDSILRELVSNHLNLIVGEERAAKYGGRLRSLIGSNLSPSNICWISTSHRAVAAHTGHSADTQSSKSPARQDHYPVKVYRRPRHRINQGREHALRVLDWAGSSPGGRQYVGSAPVHRQKTCSPVPEASRAVIDWLRNTRHVQNAGFDKIRIVRDNERAFSVRNTVGTANEIAARPRTVESCRGDNPSAVVVDESASNHLRAAHVSSADPLRSRICEEGLVLVRSKACKPTRIRNLTPV